LKRQPELDAERTLAIARLIEAKDAATRDRALLDAALTASSGVAAALWVRHSAGWSCVLERGPEEALPRESLLRALLEVDLREDMLPAGQMLTCTGYSVGDLALAVGGALRSEASDVLYALLLVRRLLDTEGGADESRPHPPYRSSQCAPDEPLA